jgi:hypothetical protein
MNPRRMTWAALALLACGCTVEVPFELAVELPLEASTGAATVALPVDLAGEPAIWENRESVRDLSVDGVVLTLLAVDDRNACESLDLSLGLEGAAEDGGSVEPVPLVDGLVLQVEERGSSELAIDSEAAAEVILGALRGSGRLTLAVSAAAERRVGVRLEARLRGAVTVAP